MSLKKFHLKVNAHIELKVPVVEDAEKLIALVNSSRDNLENYMVWAPVTNTIEDVISFINSNEHISIYDKDFPLTIWYKGEIVGITGYNKGDKINQKVDIGYWIADKYSGLGIITKASQALVNFAFSMKNVLTIYIKCDISNIKSYAVADRLGFEFINEEEGEGYLKDGKPVLLTYVLLKK